MRKRLYAVDYSASYHRTMLRADEHRGARTTGMDVRIRKYENNRRSSVLLDRWAGATDAR